MRRPPPSRTFPAKPYISGFTRTSKEEAGGAGKGIYKDFDATVDGSTLEIHLYCSVPNKGVYGPLISAIAVTPSELPPGFTTSLATASFC